MIRTKNPWYFYCLLHTMALERHVTRALISLANDSLSTSVHLSVNLPPSFHSSTQNLVLSGKVRTGSIWADSPVAK